MIAACLRVQRHIQLRFDSGEARLTDRDAIHLQSCPRCGGLFRRYSQFARELRTEAAASVAGLEAPDWQGVFASAGSRADTPANEFDRGTGGELEPTRAMLRRIRGAGPLHRAEIRAGDVFRRLPAWARGTAAKAALIAVVLCLGALLGYREYRVTAARNFVRANTSQFVDAIFSSSIFSASPVASAESTETVAVDSAWFDVSGPSVQLPLVPPSLSGSPGGGTPPASAP